MSLLDPTSLHLLDILQRDGRASIIDLSRAVNRAESTVRERILALEREGVIRGYHAQVDVEKLGFHAQAVLRADCDLRSVPDLAKKLEAIPNVTAAMMTTGSKPLVVHVVAENLPRLEQVLERRVALIGLEHIEAALSVHTLVGARPLSLQTPPMGPETPMVVHPPGGHPGETISGAPRLSPVRWDGGPDVGGRGPA